MTVRTSDSMVATSLTRVVEAFGADLLDDARRVRACLTDELGVAARPRRAEVDAVVIAAEEGVPASLVAGPLDRAAALSAIERRGLSSEAASYALDAWRHALGLAGPMSVAPALVSVVEAGAVADDVTEPSLIVDLTEGAEDGANTAPEPMAGYPPPPPPQPPGLPGVVVGAPQAGAQAPSTPGARKRVLALAVAAGILIVAVVASFLVFRDTTKQAVLTSDTSKQGAASLRFDAEKLDWGASVTRSWRAQGKGLHGELEFTNPGTAAVTGRHIEVIPKSLAATANLVQAVPKPSAVLVDDPVLAFDLTVEPGKSQVVVYDIVASGVTAAKLATWKTEQATALRDYLVTTTTTTTTTSTTVAAAVPNGGAVTPGAGTPAGGGLPGVTPGGGTGTKVPTGGTGSKVPTAGGGGTGSKVPTAGGGGTGSKVPTAGGGGTTNTGTVCWNGTTVYAPATCPAKPVATTTTTCDPNNPVQTANCTTTTTNSPPKVAVGTQRYNAKPLTNGNTYIDLWVNSGFTDPDGDAWEFAGAYNGQYGTAKIVSCTSTDTSSGAVAAHKCIRYTPSASYDYCYTDSITVWAWDPAGSKKASPGLVINIGVNCG